MDGSGHDWVAQARQGDTTAFRQLVELHARPLFRVCVRITADEALAEDAVQEALYKAWRGLPAFDGRAAFATWLHQIAVNATLEQLRRNARHRVELTADDDEDDLLGSCDDELPGPDAHAEGNEIGRRVQQQLSDLSALERTAFVLRHYEGASLDEIAATLSLNIGQTKQAVFRAVRKLRAALHAWRN